MKRLILHATSFNSFWAHYSLLEDSMFYETFRNNGYELKLSNSTEITDQDYVLFVEAKSLNYLPYLLRNMGLISGIKFGLKYFLKKLKSKNALNADLYSRLKAEDRLDKAMLLILEGKIDAPENHSRALAKYCKYIFTWNDDLVDGKKFIKINWPQPVFWPKFQSIPFAEKKYLTNISGNKYSTNELELYSLRRQSIKYFEQELGDQFDLYGIGWNEPVTFWQRIFKSTVPIFKSYAGLADSKPDTFSKYRFALIYENAQVPGYITEKIIDCFRCQCVPIYMGAPNVENYISKDTYIDRREFKDDQSLLSFLNKIDETEYGYYLERISAFLNGPKFASHISTALAKKIISQINIGKGTPNW